MRTFLQLQTDVFAQLKEEKGDDGFWTEQQVKDAINDAYLFIADDALCFRYVRIIEVIAGIVTYKMPYYHVFGSLNRVEFDSEKIWPTTFDELDLSNRTWRNRESSRITNYVVDISDEIVVYPKPDTSGSVYNLASDSEDLGVITTIGDDSYEEFDRDEGVIVDTDGEARFDETEGTWPVMEIQDPENNLKVFGARYPKRLFGDTEVCLHPVSHNPRKVLTSGALGILLAKEGAGKDIQKASFHNKRFMEKLKMFKRSDIKRSHTIKSISDTVDYGNLNLGNNYPRYYR